MSTNPHDAFTQMPPGFGPDDYARLSNELMKFALESQALFGKLGQPPGADSADPFNLGEAFAKAGQKLWTDPARVMQANMRLWQDHMQLWQQASAGLLGSSEAEPVAKPGKGDRRFRHEAWQTNPLFDLIKQSYLITSRWLVDMMAGAEDLDEDTARKVRFFTQQFADAFSPTNFIWTNPEVAEETLKTNGANLLRGLENFKRDVEKGGGSLEISMTDPEAFVLGENIATTPGKVVFQNDLFQLIQYEAVTEQVHKRPLLIVPPWINKYYILDLAPKNSFIKWAVERGYTVFVMSWVNPDSDLAEKPFEAYMTEGILTAVDAVKKATGVKSMTAIGYCIGGTLLAATLAVMAARQDKSIRAATFFTAQVDFSEPGDLQIFVDDKQVENVERLSADKGYLDSKYMFQTFNMLRSNDLIWSFYVNNYLLGRDPMPFDLLFWNADSTRMPRACHLYYLREMYMNNNLVKPNALKLDGTPVDLRKVEIPIYLQASKEDHIAPYPSVFKAMQHFAGPVRFMLSGSGHTAGVINPPAKQKYQFWINEAQPRDLDAWLDGADEHPGSWWPDWDAWLSEHSGKMVPARVPGDGELDVIENAPGSYVANRSQ
ncbi:MAG: class I poly(R)-hydroxyalkanoic acid synthase [Gammaproteobacteria bacterium]|nr:class I poly(R)-hydroxyalkanoic acid synthase [Gammaproteobacteria bacterium]